MEILVCPGCRTWTPDRLDVRTLEPAGDALACACGRRYPLHDGVPIVLAEPNADLLEADARGLPTAEAGTDDAGGRVREPAGEVPGPDDATYPRLLEHLSIYMDNQWGDRATPPPDGPGAGFAEALVARIAARAGDRVGLAVELGCSVGRVVAELARGADHVVGVDLHPAAVARARRLLAGEPVTYARRTIGRHYTTATARAGELATDRVTLVCGDALDPPLVPGVYDRVVALNLVDSVAHPFQLLSVVDALCAPGGELVLASPYSWQSAIVDDRERIGGADPGRALIAILETGANLRSRYRIEEEAELPWTLRRDARSAATYRTHYLRARRL